jgi:hypothetical protein
LIKSRNPSPDVTFSLRRMVASAYLLASALVFLSSGAWAVEFVAADDSKVTGDIIRFTESTVTIRPSGGNMIMLASDSIKRVRYSLDDGRTIDGVLHDWYDGIYVLEVEGKLVGVKNGALMPEDFVTRPDEPKQKPDDSGEPAVSKPAPPEDAELTTPPVAPIPEPDEPVEAQAPSEATESADQDSLVEISAKADVTSEKDEELVFNISSSRPWSDDIIVLFTTLDGSAKAGADFESRRGVVRLPAGATSVQLAIPLIDDDEAEDDERLTLLLSSAMGVATIPERKIVATIRDND